MTHHKDLELDDTGNVILPPSEEENLRSELIAAQVEIATLQEALAFLEAHAENLELELKTYRNPSRVREERDLPTLQPTRLDIGL